MTDGPSLASSSESAAALVAIKATHVVVLTGECDGCGTTDHTSKCCNYQHSYDWQVLCNGVTDECRAWYECLRCQKVLSGDDKRAADTLSDALWDDGMAHGVQHRTIGSLGWCTPTESCLLAVSDSTCDSVAALDLPIGVHPVNIDDIDDDYVTLVLAEPADAQRADQPLPGSGVST